jgi:hypothetical protein
VSSLRDKHFLATDQKLKDNQNKLNEADKQFRDDPYFKKLTD